MFFTITYDYSYKVEWHAPNGEFKSEWRHYANNMVGRDGKTPVGYGPVGPGSIFTLEELPEVVRVLTEQLKTIPTLHLHPAPDCG